MPLRWGVAVLPRLLIPAKNLIAHANPSENAAEKGADLLDRGNGTGRAIPPRRLAA